MLKLNANYSDYTDETDENYPEGKAINASTSESYDGTPLLDSFMNDLNAAHIAMYKKAYGSTEGISGEADTQLESQFANAVEKYVTDKIKEHSDKRGTNAHGATVAAEAGQLISRDSRGSAEIADPVTDEEIANKKYVDIETTRATGVEGLLSNLTTTVRTSLVAAINEVLSLFNSHKNNTTNPHAVAGSQLAGAVPTAKIEDAAVTTAKIADDAVTTAKLADDAVTTPNILAKSVTSAKIDDEAIITTKIAPAAVTAAKLSPSAYEYSRLIYGVCSTSATTQEKSVSIGNLKVAAVKEGLSFKVTFVNGSSYGDTWGQCYGLTGETGNASENTIREGAAPKLKIVCEDGTSAAYPITIAGQLAGEGFVEAYETHTFILVQRDDLESGFAFEDETAINIYCNKNRNYSKKRDGLIEQWISEHSTLAGVAEDYHLMLPFNSSSFVMHGIYTGANSVVNACANIAYISSKTVRIYSGGGTYNLYFKGY